MWDLVVGVTIFRFSVGHVYTAGLTIKQTLNLSLEVWDAVFWGCNQVKKWNVGACVIYKYFLLLIFLHRGEHSLKWFSERKIWLLHANIGWTGKKSQKLVIERGKNNKWYSIPLYLVTTVELKHWGSWKLTVSVVLLLTLKRTIDGASGAPEQGKKMNFLVVIKQQHSL